MHKFLNQFTITLILLFFGISKTRTENCNHNAISIRYISVSSTLINPILAKSDIKMYTLYLKLSLFLFNKRAKNSRSYFLVGKIDLAENNMDTLPYNFNEVMTINKNNKYGAFKIYQMPEIVDSSLHDSDIVIPPESTPKILTKVKLNFIMEDEYYKIFQNSCCGVDDPMKVYDVNISNDTLYLDFIFDLSNSNLVKLTEEKFCLDTLSF